MTTSANYNNIISDYFSVLMGDKLNFQISFNKENREVSLRNFRVIARFAIEEILGWTMEVAQINLTKQVLTDLCLIKALKKFNPNEEVNNYSMKCILHMIYPQIQYSIEAEAVDIFKQYLQIDEYVNSEPKSLPKAYFLDTKDANIRVRSIVSYLIKRDFSGMEMLEIYDFFNDTKKVNEWLKERKLSNIINAAYDSPTSMLQDIFNYHSNIDTANYIAYKLLNNGDNTNLHNADVFYDILDKADLVDTDIFVSGVPVYSEFKEIVENNINNYIWIIIYIASNPFKRLGYCNNENIEALTKYCKDLLLNFEIFAE